MVHRKRGEGGEEVRGDDIILSTLQRIITRSPLHFQMSPWGESLLAPASSATSLQATDGNKSINTAASDDKRTMILQRPRPSPIPFGHLLLPSFSSSVMSSKTSSPVPTSPAAANLFSPIAIPVQHPNPQSTQQQNHKQKQQYSLSAFRVPSTVGNRAPQLNNNSSSFKEFKPITPSIASSSTSCSAFEHVSQKRRIGADAAPAPPVISTSSATINTSKSVEAREGVPSDTDNNSTNGDPIKKPIAQRAERDLEKVLREALKTRDNVTPKDIEIYSHHLTLQKQAQENMKRFQVKQQQGAMKRVPSSNYRLQQLQQPISPTSIKAASELPQEDTLMKQQQPALITPNRCSGDLRDSLPGASGDDCYSLSLFDQQQASINLLGQHHQQQNNSTHNTANQNLFANGSNETESSSLSTASTGTTATPNLSCTKRKRTDQTTYSLLEDVFLRDPLPSRKTKEKLAQELGLTPRRVQVWFQVSTHAHTHTQQQQSHDTTPFYILSLSLSHTPHTHTPTQHICHIGHGHTHTH